MKKEAGKREIDYYSIKTVGGVGKKRTVRGYRKKESKRRRN